MKEITEPFEHELLLIGGGHTHALLLRMLGMNPMPRVRTTLVSDVAYAPYSGMLPGLVAGVYSYEEAHIDLIRLCEFAKVQLVLQAVDGFDLEKKRVCLSGRSELSFDVLSINIGSAAMGANIPGVTEFATPAKPVPEFIKKWESVCSAAEQGAATSVVIVGGGAGGAELALAMNKRLGENGKITLIERAEVLLAEHNRGVQSSILQVLKKQGVAVMLGKVVESVTAEGIVFEDHRKVNADEVFWVTGARAQPWLAETELALDPSGFIDVTATLQSSSHPFVFSAGDVASMRETPMPKAGVFAVRQAKPLYHNLKHYFLGKPLVPYKPQKNFLSLLSTASSSAIASRGKLSGNSALFWKLKDYIDRRFMRRFSELPLMPSAEKGAQGDVAGEAIHSAMRCVGCAAKVDSNLLSSVLERLRQEAIGFAERQLVLSRLDHLDDAAEIELPVQSTLFQSVDILPAILPDPYEFGRVAVVHALSDLYAMGVSPHSVQCLIGVPYAKEHLMRESLYQVMIGIVDELSKHQTLLLGGHTFELRNEKQLSVGLVCNGFLSSGKSLHKSGAKVGDKILLSKALGIGALFAAQMRLQAKGEWIFEARRQLLLSNREAANCFLSAGANALTDVTGFGLARHLLEVVTASGVRAQLSLESIPVLPGTIQVLEMGIESSLASANAAIEEELQIVDKKVFTARQSLLFDPQTCGGLLGCVPQDRAESCLQSLLDAGCSDASIIGEIIELDESSQQLIVLSH